MENRLRRARLRERAGIYPSIINNWEPQLAAAAIHRMMPTAVRRNSGRYNVTQALGLSSPNPEHIMSDHHHHHRPASFSGFNPAADSLPRQHRLEFSLNLPSSNSSSNFPNSGSTSTEFQFLPPNAPPPAASTRLREEYASKNNRTILIDDVKYEHIEETDFEKLSELGSGTFGQVEQMLHRPSNWKIAVKKMRRSGNADDNKHIINDLELLRKCRHFANIVQYYGYYIMEAEVWIFMELMTTCFERLLRRLRLRNGQAVPEAILGKTVVATINALDYLKVKHNVMHRDVKPSNILINRQGAIKLCDFGISGRLIDSHAHTRTVGCKAYLAPERIKQSGKPYDIRADVWSLGLTLLEMATGVYPYGTLQEFELMTAIVMGETPTLPSDGGPWSEAFGDFIEKCLTKEPTDRPKYRELMKQPFYLNSQSAVVDVATWFNEAYDTL